MKDEPFFTFLSVGAGKFLYHDICDRENELIQNWDDPKNILVRKYSINGINLSSEDEIFLESIVTVYRLDNKKILVLKPGIKNDYKFAKDWIDKFRLTDEFLELCIFQLSKILELHFFWKEIKNRKDILEIFSYLYDIEEYKKKSSETMEHIYLKILNINGALISLIPNPTDNMIRTALASTAHSDFPILSHIKNPTKEIIELVLNIHPLPNIKYIPNLTDEQYKDALLADGNVVCLIDNLKEEHIKLAMQSKISPELYNLYNALHRIWDVSEDMCKKLIDNNPDIYVNCLYKLPCCKNSEKICKYALDRAIKSLIDPSCSTYYQHQQKQQNYPNNIYRHHQQQSWQGNSLFNNISIVNAVQCVFSTFRSICTPTEEMIRMFLNCFAYCLNDPNLSINLTTSYIRDIKAHLEYVFKRQPQLLTEQIIVTSFSLGLLPDNIKIKDEITNTEKINRIKKEPKIIFQIANPTTEMYVEALQLNPDFFPFFKNKSKELCMAAIEIVPSLIVHIKKPSKKLIKAAIKKDPTVIKYIRNQSDDIVELATNIANMNKMKD